MSLDERGYLSNINKERTRTHNAIIPAVEPPKTQDKKLCPNCRRSFMKIIIQDESKYTDESGLDPSGAKPGTAYYVCELIECMYKMSIPSLQRDDKGYRTKNSVVSTLPMHLRTFDPRKKVRRGGRRDDVSDEDLADLASLTGGYIPDVVDVVYSRDTYPT